MSGGGDTTTVQQSDPWSGQQPYLTDLFRQAQGQYGNLPQYFPDATYVPFSPQTELGLNMTMDRALNNPLTMGAEYAALGGMMQNRPDLAYGIGGANQAISGIPGAQNIFSQFGQAPGLGDTSGFAFGANPFEQASIANQAYGPMQIPGMPGGGEGAFGAANQYVQDVMAGAPTSAQGSIDQIMGNLGGFQGPQGPGGFQEFAGAQVDPTAQAALSQFATGVPGQNPYLDQQIDIAQRRAIDQIAPETAAQFGLAGRTGSGMHADILGDRLGQAVGDIETQMRGAAYESDRARALSAAGQLGQLGLGAGQIGLGARGQTLGARGQDIDFGLGAGQQGLTARGQDLGAIGIGADLFSGAAQRGLGAAGLGGDLFSRGSQDFLGRFGAGSDLYLGERGLGQQATQIGLADDLARRDLMADLYTSGADRSLTAGQYLGDMGMEGLGALGDFYGNVSQDIARGGVLGNMANTMGYGDIGNILGVGGAVEGQAGDVLQDAINRWNFGQMAPIEALQRYSGIVQNSPLPGTTTTTGPSGQGSPLAGAIGGGMAGLGAYGGLVGSGVLAGGAGTGLAAIGPVGWGLMGLGALGGLL